MFTELKAIAKDEGVLLFFIFLPVVYPLLYSWIYNNEVVHEVPVVLVDDSHSAASREFAQKYDASSDVSIAYRCSSIQEAKNLIGHGQAYGIIYFPSDFDRSIGRREQAHVSVYCDMSYMLAYKAIYSSATAVSQEMGAGIQRQLLAGKTAREGDVATQPLSFDEVPIFNNTGGYGNFIIPGVLLLIIHQAILLGVGMIGGTEREKSFANYRCRKHRNKLQQALNMLCGKTMAYAMLFAMMLAWITLVIPHVFGFVSMLHAKDLFLFLIPYLFACIFFSITVSEIVRYRESVMLVVVFTSVPLLFMSGVSWPQSGIPGGWQGVSTVFPSTFGIRGFIRMNSMGALLPDVMKEWHALWLQTVCYACTAMLVMWTRVKAAESCKHKGSGKEEK